MSDRIEPALSAEEWEKILPDPFIVADYDGDINLYSATAIKGTAVVVTDRPQALIAAANAALPDSDPRKITRDTIAAIRNGADVIEGEERGTDDDNYTPLRAIAAALESYLPPEP